MCLPSRPLSVYLLTAIKKANTLRSFLFYLCSPGPDQTDPAPPILPPPRQAQKKAELEKAAADAKAKKVQYFTFRTHIRTYIYIYTKYAFMYITKKKMIFKAFQGGISAVCIRLELSVHYSEIRPVFIYRSDCKYRRFPFKTPPYMEDPALFRNQTYSARKYRSREHKPNIYLGQP